MFALLTSWSPAVKNTSGKAGIPLPLFSIFLLAGMMILNSCGKDPTVPILTTDPAEDITASSVTLSGTVTDDGGAEVTARGICWGTVTLPTVNDNFKPSGTGTGSFTCSIDGLNPNIQYFARAYAQNSVGIAYGNEIEFTTGLAAPEVTTTQVSDITATSAICSGEITNDGGSSVNEKGICWSTTPDPDLEDSHAAASTGSQTFSCSLANLAPGTKYYFRAYVKNSAWTVYGAQLVFNTKVEDIEGNLYNTVNIGTQVWMSENLRVTKFNNNISIPNVTDNTEWLNLTGAAYCWYNNDVQYKSTMGAMYSWYTVTAGDLCPAGWHVPTDEEFGTLEIYLGMNPDLVNVWGWRGTDQGTQMKSVSGWDDEGNGSNTSGFTGLPGGYRYAATGAFYSMGNLTYWWTATEYDAEEGWYRRLDGSNSDVYRACTLKQGGKYIRCIKD